MTIYLMQNNILILFLEFSTAKINFTSLVKFFGKKMIRREEMGKHEEKGAPGKQTIKLIKHLSKNFFYNYRTLQSRS